ncbi:glycosyltransferase family 2 protein [Alcanivorax sp. S6407]|uniref:glycosyltransferase family 2 protein n=1 Tax=Alcanivorax sp. S6407 TaxID=2926424 RepID=UPI001FF42766|nr:glycosyltransferase family 2 protein [Alcanivorax sp. S6407]MCK0152859.1 glycosyltransferase family 2 protein [Alcanivorax sp. S6407]
MKISIAMASYNGEKYIREQLESFLTQTRLPDELIITDDCSNDITEEIVNEFSSRAPFKVVFHKNKKNHGYCGNFNEALIRTTGDIVFLSDQDDVWFPEKIERMVSLAEKNPDKLLLMNDAVLTDAHLNPLEVTRLDQFRSGGMNLDDFVMGCCCLIKREFLELALPIPEEYHSHDHWLVKLADGMSSKMVVDTALQYYRRHENNVSKLVIGNAPIIEKIDFRELLIWRFLDPLRKRSERLSLEQKKAFLLGVNRIVSLTSSQNRDLELFLQYKTDEVRNLEERVAIREQKLVQRLRAVFKFWVNGKYAAHSGIKSVIRDVWG